MVWFLVVLGVIALLAVGATLALYCIRVDRALIARAEVRGRQRQAEADTQRVVQHTIAQLFEAARRQK
jgi:hypothetical protein